jgi:hypothetical protein
MLSFLFLIGLWSSSANNAKHLLLLFFFGRLLVVLAQAGFLISLSTLQCFPLALRPIRILPSSYCLNVLLFLFSTDDERSSRCNRKVACIALSLSKGYRTNLSVVVWWNSCTVTSRAKPYTVGERQVEIRILPVSTLIQEKALLASYLWTLKAGGIKKKPRSPSYIPSEPNSSLPLSSKYNLVRRFL